MFEIVSKNKPAGDQPKAIDALVSGLKKGYENQTLLGVTGSGKTFTIANVIERTQMPTLAIGVPGETNPNGSMHGRDTKHCVSTGEESYL